MNQYKYSLIVLIIISALLSCKKDFLDVPTKNVVLRQAYVTDLKTTNDYLNGMYVSLASAINNTGINYAELIADNIKPKTGSPVLSSHYTWNQVPGDNKPGSIEATGVNANGLWISGIKIAQGCSFVIENSVRYKGENPTLADNIAGQAYALRALIHSMMVNVFAQSYAFTPDGSHPGIPYTTTSDWTIPATRLSVAEVYEAMVEDLNNAIVLLPNAQTAPPTFKNALINKTTAKAILARVYLFKGEWQAAKNLAREVAMLVPIMTGPGVYPGKLFTNDESEALFQLPPSNPAATLGAGSYGTNFGGSLFNGTLLHLVATNDIAALLRENTGDVRASWVKDTISGLGTVIKKYPQNVISGFSNPTLSYFQTLIRSSEMYLTAAECYAQLSVPDSAIFYLDAIRKRAWSAAPPTTATGTALMDSIYKERRKELCFEGLRMYDIQRWKQSVNRLDASNPNAKVLPYGSGKAIAPIPVSDVQQLGMTQNPSY